MNCRHGASTWTTRQSQPTDWGYAIYRCRSDRRWFNERTGTPFNVLAFATDIVFQVRLCRYRDKLSRREVAELFLRRGYTFTPETVRGWQERFSGYFADPLREKRRGGLGRVGSVDETSVKVQGRWCDLYRASDQDGNLVDSRLSETRDRDAAQAFFTQALSPLKRRCV